MSLNGQSEAFSGRIVLPSAVVLDHVDHGRLRNAIQVYSLETGASTEQAETILQDESVLTAARQRAQELSQRAVARQKADNEARRHMPRPIWAYAVGALALIVLVREAFFINSLVEESQRPGGGDALMILMFASPVLFIVAVAAVAVLGVCFFARKKPSERG